MRWDVTISRVRELVDQGVPKKEVARRLGVAPATVRDRLNGMGPDRPARDGPSRDREGRVRTARLREAIPPGQVPLLALRLGWDESVVRSRLGCKPKDGPAQRSVALDDALALLDAAGVDPREAGL